MNMENIIYINHLKNSCRTWEGNRYIAIDAKSCYFLNEITNDLVDLLPDKGTADEFLQFLQDNGIKNEEKVLLKLISAGVIIKEKSKSFKEILAKIISPDIQMFSPFFLEKVFARVGKIKFSDAIKQKILFALAAFFVINAYLICNFGINSYGNGYLLLIMVLAGSLVHEIGHSYMMFASGLGSRNMGLFFYLIYPSFYVNMSGVERLNLLDKTLANASGFLFQSIYCLFLVFIYLVSGEKIFLNAYFWSCALMLFNLNPFLRTDGFWLYKDFIADRKGSLGWAIFNQVYLLFAFLFTLYFSWYLLSGIWNIVSGMEVLSMKNISFKTLLTSYMGILSVKSLINKINEFLNEIGSLTNPHRDNAMRVCRPEKRI